MFRIISEGRTIQGKIARRKDERAIRRLPRVIAIIVTGPAAGVTTPAQPADDRTKQNWIFINDDNVTRSSPPPLCFPLQRTLSPAKPPFFLPSSLSLSRFRSLVLLVHLALSAFTSSPPLLFRCNANAYTIYMISRMRALSVPFQQNSVPALNTGLIIIQKV